MHKSKLVSEGRGLRSVPGGHPVLGYHQDESQAIAGSDPSGFSGTCETTLTDWIQLVQMGRRDAVVSLRTHDGKEGTLWCRGGDIIDAACDGLAGEDAVYRALTWRGGRVSVDFASFSHGHEIQIATAGLLLEAAHRQDAAVHDTGQADSLSDGAPPPGTPGGPVTTGTADVASPRPMRRKAHRQTAMLLGVAGGTLALLLAVGLVWKWKFSARHQGATVQTPAGELLPRPGANPWPGAMVLDGKQVGVGKPKMSLPPASKVSVAEVGPIGKRARAPSNTAKGLRTHRRVVKLQADSVRPTSSDSESPRREYGSAKVKVQIIEEPRPRIQIIDERKPQIDVIE